MKEAKGDLWTYPAEYRVVTTNGVVGPKGLVMGAGVALQAKERFPDLPEKLGKWVKLYGNRPFICREACVLSYPTKHHWKDDSSLALIESGARLLVEIADKHGITSVAMTRPGCGNGRLLWSQVKPRIERILDDRFTVLTP